MSTVFTRIMIASVLAGTTSVAAAASSVTLFGVADAGVQYLKIKGQDSTTGLVDGGKAASRWGLRGSEDLGGGTKANFLLDSGFNIVNGRSAQGGRLFGRSAWVGLSNSAWGEVRLGRQPLSSSDLISPFAATGASYKLASAGAAINTITFTRADSAVKYLTPKLGGFEGSITYAFNATLPFNTDGTGSVATTSRSDRIASAAGRYSVGDLKIGLFYDHLWLGRDTSSAGRHYDVKPQAYGLGLTYKLGDYTLHGVAAQHKDAYINGTQAGNVGQVATFQGGKVNGYVLGVTGPLGSGNFFAQAQYIDPNSKVERAGEKAHSQQVYSLGYIHPLSKRTSLYAYATHLRGAWFDTTGSNGQTISARKWNGSQIIAGVSHTF